MALNGYRNLPANNDTDPVTDWERVAGEFIRSRNTGIGAEIIRQWSSRLAPGCAVLDMGCGFGEPCTGMLAAAGHRMYGIDASPTMLAEYRRRFPQAPAACERAEHSTCFERRFGGIIAIGLLFLLPAEKQKQVLQNVAGHLEPGGSFLFTSPARPCAWRDSLTGNRSQSLGKTVYETELSGLGLVLSGEYRDAGDNHYFAFTKR